MKKPKLIECGHCGNPATCIGMYEQMISPVPACDDCCGHGCEDGHCDPIDSDKGKAAMRKMSN